MGKYLDSRGLVTLWNKIKGCFVSGGVISGYDTPLTIHNGNLQFGSDFDVGTSNGVQGSLILSNAVTSKLNKVYWANVQNDLSANYITQPEFKSVKINGSTTNSASSSNCVLQYDTTNKCLKFVFN